MGVGGTLLGASLLEPKRNAVGIDLSKEYIEILASDLNRADYFEKAVQLAPDLAKAIADLMINKNLDKEYPEPAGLVKKILEITKVEYASEEDHMLAIQQVVIANHSVVTSYKNGKGQVIGFLIGQVQKKLNGMILEVFGSNPDGHNNPGDNDDGVALLEASKHLADQTAKNKFLVVLSDGLPETNYKSSAQLSRELKEAVAEVTTNTNQELIGIGLMSNAVRKYYKNNISGVSTKEMTEVLGELLREIIEKY